MEVIRFKSILGLSFFWTILRAAPIVEERRVRATGREQFYLLFAGRGLTDVTVLPLKFDVALEVRPQFVALIASYQARRKGANASARTINKEHQALRQIIENAGLSGFKVGRPYGQFISSA